MAYTVAFSKRKELRPDLRAPSMCNHLRLISMRDMTHIRLELGISAERFVQQVMLNNEAVEEQIKKGIELALNDMFVESNFVEHVRNEFKEELNNLIRSNVSSWQVRNMIQKKLEEAVGKKIDEYADRISENITKNLI